MPQIPGTGETNLTMAAGFEKDRVQEERMNDNGGTWGTKWWSSAGCKMGDIPSLVRHVAPHACLHQLSVSL